MQDLLILTTLDFNTLDSFWQFECLVLRFQKLIKEQAQQTLCFEDFETVYVLQLFQVAMFSQGLNREQAD
jgi:hypothetical protein